MAHVCTSSGMSRTARTSPSRSRCTVVSGTGEDAVRLGVLGRRPLAVHGADFGPALPVDGPEPVALVGVADHDPPHGLRVAARRRLGGVLDDRPDVLVGHGSRRVDPPHGPGRAHRLEDVHGPGPYDAPRPAASGGTTRVRELRSWGRAGDAGVLGARPPGPPCG